MTCATMTVDVEDDDSDVRDDDSDVRDDDSDVRDDDADGQATSTLCAVSTDDDGDASDASEDVTVCTTSNSVSPSSTVPLLASHVQLSASAVSSSEPRFALLMTKKGLMRNEHE